MDDENNKKNRKPKGGSCSTLFLVVLIAGIAFLGLDAAEYLSLGIVKGVMKLKVLTTEDYDTLTGDLSQKTKELDETKAKLASKEQEVQKLAPLQNQVNTLTAERDKANKELADVKKQVNDLTGQKDEAQKEVAKLKTSVEEITKQLEEANAKNAEREEKEEQEEPAAV
jgi:septal ring factor EnvC (AmiA/AmiB activator)